MLLIKFCKNVLWNVIPELFQKQITNTILCIKLLFRVHLPVWKILIHGAFSSWALEVIDRTSYRPLDEAASKKDKILNFYVSQAILLVGKTAWLKYLWFVLDISLCHAQPHTFCMLSSTSWVFSHKAHLLFAKIVLFLLLNKACDFDLPHLFTQRDHWLKKFVTISYLFNVYFFDTS